MKEELLTEEESLKLLKINKAQLENYVREGRLAPLYQESVRKFKLSDISRITSETPAPPSIEPSEVEQPFIKTLREGSTRIIEAPTETTKIGISRTGTKGTTFEASQDTEKFLQLDGNAGKKEGNLTPILLTVAFVISAFSVTMLTFTLRGQEIPQITKILSGLGSILPMDKAEINKIESETNSVLQTAKQTKQNAEVLIKETEEFINIKK